MHILVLIVAEVGTPSGTPGATSPKADVEEDGEEEGSSSEEESDDGKTWCICNGPDDGRKMINCDGCENWFHLKCLKIPDHVGDLIKDFYCPACTSAENRTKYNPHCSSKPCMKPARIELFPKGEWKYCSDDHGRRYARDALKKARDDEEASRGGELNRGELLNMLEQTQGTDEWRRLGQKPRVDAAKMMELKQKTEGQPEQFSAFESPQPTLPSQETPIDTVEQGDEDVHMRGGGGEQMDEILDESLFDPGQYDEQLLNEDEMSRIIEIEDEKAKAKATVELYKRKGELLNGIKEKNAILLSQISALEKRSMMCGFDSILALNDPQLVAFLETKEDSTFVVPEVDTVKLASGDKLFGPYKRDDGVDAFHSTCTRKKCLKHGEWSKIFKEDTRYQAFLANRMEEKLGNEEREIREVAQVRAMVDDE